MRITNSAPAGGGGGGAVAQGWRRFLLDGADYTDDPHSQTGSLTESDTETAWVSTASGSLLGTNDGKPNHGAIYTRPLVDANGTALDWQRPFSVDFMIEKTVAEPWHNAANSYFGGGLTSVTSGMDTGATLGMVSAWNALSGANSQRSYRFRMDSWDNQGACSRDWDTAFTMVHGARQHIANGMMRLLSHRFDPVTPDGGSGDTSLGNYPQGTTRFPASGPVYIFATCGRTQSWGTAKTTRFRLYYAVTGADQDWTP